ncbi:MAG: hypothetical protein NC417_02405 [Candidatus Gastranaerophilales bacterium]|nr:hypothetical protein [Candidatus Gastranaerophilales bacterium]
MEIKYKTKKLRKICTDATKAEKTYGKEMSEKIQMRIDEILAVDTVEMMMDNHIGRCHSLKGDRKGQ